MSVKEKETSQGESAPAPESDDGESKVCKKAFNQETARNEDEDEPCSDGSG